MRTKHMRTKRQMKTASRSRHLHSVRVEFTQMHARKVFIAGTFNDWQPSATPMISQGGGRWAQELTLAPGHYEYRFVVDGEWINDPAAKETVPNPFGGNNSILIAAAD